MPNYRRAHTPGGTYFFTVKTYERQPVLTQERCRIALQEAIADVRGMHSFKTIAWVLLPDHLHTIWRMPEHDADFSLCWSLIKKRVSRQCADKVSRATLSQSRMKRKEGAFWQRRFWEHMIRDDTDLRHHVDYIHYNPVKHGYAKRVADWPYSSFHRYVNDGVYPKDWGGAVEALEQSFGE